MLGLVLMSVLALKFSPVHGITCSDTKVAVPEGHPACLLCHVIPDKPRVGIWWRKGSPPSQLQEERRFYVDDLGTLYISYVIPGDAGPYGCSSPGNDTITFGRNVTLNVTSGSSQRKPKLLWSSSNMTRSSRYPKNLVCVFSGRPVPNITWWRGHKGITEGVQTVGMKSVLTLPAVPFPHRATYTCMGDNGIGQMRIDINLFKMMSDTRLLPWIWAGLGVVAFLSACAIARCCYRWCSWKRKRRDMLRKEAEGYRMGHEEEEEEMGNMEETKNRESKNSIEGTEKHGHKGQERENEGNHLEEKDSHGIMRKETETNLVQDAEAIESCLTYVHKTTDHGTNDNQIKNNTQNKGRNAMEKDNSPTITEEGQQGADKPGENFSRGKNVDLTETREKNVDLTETIGTNVDLTDTRGMNVDLTETKGKDVDLAETKGKDVDRAETKGKDVDLAETRETNVDRMETRGTNVDLAGTMGKNVDLTETRGKNVNLTETRGKNVDLTETRGKNVDLAETRGKNVDLAETGGMNVEEVTAVTSGDKTGQIVNYDKEMGLADEDPKASGICTEYTNIHVINSVDNENSNGKERETQSNGKNTEEEGIAGTHPWETGKVCSGQGSEESEA